MHIYPSIRIFRHIQLQPTAILINLIEMLKKKNLPDFFLASETSHIITIPIEECSKYPRKKVQSLPRYFSKPCNNVWRIWQQWEKSMVFMPILE